MSLRDHRGTVAAGKVAKIVNNVANRLLLKSTTTPIPTVRVQYEGTQSQSGSSRFFNMIKGDKYTAPDGARFTEIEIDNTNGALDIDYVFTVGVGDFSQTEISGAVAVAGGSLDNIVNPVQVFPSPEPAGCFPVKNCDDPANPGNPLPVVVQDIGASGGATTYGNVFNATLGQSASGTIAANANRKMLYIHNAPTSVASVAVVEDGGGFQVGPTIQPGETFTICVTGAVQVTNQSQANGGNAQVSAFEVTS